MTGSIVFVVGWLDWSRGGVGVVCVFYNTRPIQSNRENQLEGGTCVYSFFFWHSNASIAEIKILLALEQTVRIFQ